MRGPSLEDLFRMVEQMPLTTALTYSAGRWILTVHFRGHLELEMAGADLSLVLQTALAKLGLIAGPVLTRVVQADDAAFQQMRGEFLMEEMLGRRRAPQPPAAAPSLGAPKDLGAFSPKPAAPAAPAPPEPKKLR